MVGEHRHIDTPFPDHSQASSPYLEWVADTSAAPHSAVYHTLAQALSEAGSLEDEHKAAGAEHQKVIVAALSQSHPGHTASRNMLAALMAPAQAGAPVVLRLPRSSL